MTGTGGPVEVLRVVLVVPVGVHRVRSPDGTGVEGREPRWTGRASVNV